MRCTALRQRAQRSQTTAAPCEVKLSLAKKGATRHTQPHSAKHSASTAQSPSQSNTTATQCPTTSKQKEKL